MFMKTKILEYCAAAVMSMLAFLLCNLLFKFAGISSLFSLLAALLFLPSHIHLVNYFYFPSFCCRSLRSCWGLGTMSCFAPLNSCRNLISQIFQVVHS